MEGAIFDFPADAGSGVWWTTDEAKGQVTAVVEKLELCD